MGAKPLFSAKAIGTASSASAKAAAAEAAYAKTAARLQHISGHLARTPRGSQLSGKVCIITGVGSLKGIGRATAMLYAHEGAKHLYLLDYSGDNLPDLQETITSKYPDVKVTTVQADAADEKAIMDLCAQAIKEEGRLDVFFANAGVATGSAVADITSDVFKNTMRINALSAFLGIKHGSAAMMKTSATKPQSGGSILMTASIAGIRSGAGSMDYSASKAAVISLAKTGAFQLAKTDIRVNSISPGLIETGMTTQTFDYARSKGTAGKIGQLNPLGRFGIAEEIAQLALFLASDASSYVNGQDMAIDGGLSSSHPTAPGRFF